MVKKLGFAEKAWVPVRARFRRPLASTSPAA